MLRLQENGRKAEMGYKINFSVQENGCWICSLPLNSAGYPTTAAGGKISTVHRYVYESIHGSVPGDMVVRHKCDNKRCINPAHLEPGTLADNVRDRVERGRSAVGIKNGRSKLTENAARVIRVLEGISVSALSRSFGVDRKTIRQIRQGKTWKHV